MWELKIPQIAQVNYSSPTILHLHPVMEEQQSMHLTPGKEKKRI